MSAVSQNSIQVAQQYVAEGRSDLAIELLREFTKRNSTDYLAWKMLGFACHEEQLEADAAQAFGRAVILNDRDPQSAMAHAHSSYLAGLPSVELFHLLLKLVPNDLPAIRGLASALATENQDEAAESLLVDTVRRNPGWLQGHKYLATMRYTRGDTTNFTDSYAEACLAEPRNLALRLAWFRAIAQTRHWDRAREILDTTEAEFGTGAELLVGRIFVSSESGRTAEAEALFEATRTMNDPVRDMALVRHRLRTGNPAAAEAISARGVESPSAAVFWPYLSLARRLLKDPRADWLDGSPPQVQTIDLKLSRGALGRLAELLRSLHRSRSPFVEQSVRGGTQTDQNLLLRHETPLQDLRARARAAVLDYVRQLPAPVPGHPLLGLPRTEVLSGRVFLSGSWSVRLGPNGHNVSHTHPLGWISSALYISLPEPTEMGPAPGGWLQFGTPPAELNLSLSSTLQVEPKAGRLVLFPSRLWHSTVPFDSGERLAVSFDVRAPRPMSAATAYRSSLEAS